MHVSISLTKLSLRIKSSLPNINWYQITLRRCAVPYLKPFVLLDVQNPVFLIAQPFHGVLPTQSFHKIPSISELFSCYINIRKYSLKLKDCLTIFQLLTPTVWSVWGTPAIQILSEWCCRPSSGLGLWREAWWIWWIVINQLKILRSGQQLVHKYSQSPEVHGPVVSLVEDDLGSHVLRRPTECPRLAASLQLLGEAEVHHLDITDRVWRERLMNRTRQEGRRPSKRFSGLRSL